jgi:predicted PurR-regulated permease PerM/methylmalonyl-CoA mutase cobalamin-binding subunit
MPPMLVFVLALAALYFAKEVLIPLSLAALVAFLLTPAVIRLEKWHLGRIPSVSLILLVSFCAVGSLGWVAANQLIDVFGQLPDYKANIDKRFDALRNPGSGSLAKASQSLKVLSKELSAAAPSPPPVLFQKRTRKPVAAAPAAGVDSPPLPVQIVDPPSTPLQAVKSMLGPLLAPIGTAIIVLVFAVVMLIKREDLRNRILRLIGQTQLNLATQAFDDATQRVSRYLRLQFVVNLTFAAVITAGLYFIGLQNALLWGLLAGAFRFVPYVGPVIGCGLPCILALAIFGGWTQPILCIALFLVTEPVVAYVIEPALYGTHTGISSLAILVAAAVWTALWGPIGLILSTPLTVCLVVLGRYVPALGILHILLGDEPVLSPAAQLYQRLLATDQEEARAVIDSVLQERTVVELYDDVLIPALSMAEQDRHKGALDEAHEQFLLHSLEEFIVELAGYNAGKVEKAADGELRLPTEADNAEASGRREVRVVCLPCSDKADEIVTAMLAQALELAGHPTVCFPVLGSPAEVLETLSIEPGDVVCISALPPFALINARSLSKQLRERFPEVRIVLGLWNFSEGGARVDERLGKAFIVDVVTTLAQAVERVHTRADASLVGENAA